jgi:hypothetical protein
MVEPVHSLPLKGGGSGRGSEGRDPHPARRLMAGAPPSPLQGEGLLDAPIYHSEAA